MLVGLPQHPPILHRAGTPITAEAIWGADFELWGMDCPLGPGDWVDRIGGLVVTCYGSGDWARDANGYAGVTKSNVCYATGGLDVAAKIKVMGGWAGGTTRTVAMIVSGWEEMIGAPVWSSRRGPDGVDVGETVAQHSYSAMWSCSAYGSGYLWSSSRRYATSGTPGPRCLVAAAMLPNAGAGTIYELTSGTDTWVSRSSGVATPYSYGLTFFRRLGSGKLADGSARTLRFKSIAAAPGLGDLALIRTWAERNGVVWA